MIRDENIPFLLWVHVRGNVCILSRQRAAPKVTQHYTIYCLFVEFPVLKCRCNLNWGLSSYCYLLPHTVNCIRFCFWALCDTFCLCMKYLRYCWTNLCHIHRKDVFVPHSDELECQGWRSRSPGTKNGKFWPFCQPACGFCVVEHL